MLGLLAGLSGVSLSLICLITALIMFFIAAFVLDGVGTRPRIHFGWAGAFFLALAFALS